SSGWRRPGLPRRLTNLTNSRSRPLWEMMMRLANYSRNWPRAWRMSNDQDPGHCGEVNATHQDTQARLVEERSRADESAGRGHGQSGLSEPLERDQGGVRQAPGRRLGWQMRLLREVA